MAKNTLDTIATQLTQMNDRFSTLENSVKFTSDQYDEIIKKLDNIGTQSIETNQKIKVNSEKIEMLEWRLNKAEQKGLGGHIVMAGIPETKGEDTTTIVHRLMSTAKISESSHNFLKAFRMGKPQTGRIRPVKCIFSDHHIATQLVDFSRINRPSAKLLCDNFKPEQRIFISEYMTENTGKLFKLARERAKQHGWKFCWFREGSINVRRDEETRAHLIISSPLDLEKITLLQ